MPAKNLYHDAMKNALSKDGWIITKDPLTIERDARKIAVEIKSLISPSPVRDLELALGHYIIYRSSPTLTYPSLQVYLAIRLDFNLRTFGSIQNLRSHNQPLQSKRRSLTINLVAFSNRHDFRNA